MHVFREIIESGGGHRSQERKKLWGKKIAHLKITYQKTNKILVTWSGRPLASLIRQFVLWSIFVIMFSFNFSENALEILF
jgi:hypothetical protein